MTVLFLYAIFLSGQIESKPELSATAEPPTATGPSLEVVSSTLFKDEVYDDSLGAGVRLSFIETDESDFSLAPELQLMMYRPWKNLSEARYSADLSLSYQEYYRPLSFRIAAGFGFEIDDMEAEPQALIRGGFGYFFSKNWGLLGEASQRYIFREKLSLPIEISVSLLWIAGF